MGLIQLSENAMDSTRSNEGPWGLIDQMIKKFENNESVSEPDPIILKAFINRVQGMKASRADKITPIKQGHFFIDDWPNLDNQLEITKNAEVLTINNSVQGRPVYYLKTNDRKILLRFFHSEGQAHLDLLAYPDASNPELLKHLSDGYFSSHVEIN